MSNKTRNKSGKFAPKSETPRKIRSVNLTDQTWQRLAAVAEKTGKSRNDFLESLLQGNNPFIETVEPQPQPLIETVETQREADDVNKKKQPDSELWPLMETVRTEVNSPRDELEAVRTENQRLHIQLGNLQVENEALKKEVQKLLSALELPEPSDLLNQLKAKRKKTTASLADIEAILEILEES
jgi:hypothetical protein